MRRRSAGPGRRLAALAFTLCLGAGSAALAADPRAESRSQLDDVERALEAGRSEAADLQEKAAAIAQEVEALQRDMVAAAGAAQDAEERISDLEASLAALETEETATSAALAQQRGHLVDTLAALQRLSLQPPEALLLQAGSPLDTVRSAMLLRVAVPALTARAHALQQDLDRLGEVRAQITANREALAETAQRLAAEQARIAELVERKQALRQQTEAERQGATKRVAALADQAKDLRDLIERLDREAARERERAARAAAVAAAAAKAAREAEAAARAKAAAEAATPPTQEAALPSSPDAPPAPQRLQRPANIRSFPGQKTGLVLPARGKIVLHYGEGTSVTGKGITIETRVGAQVVAPFDGQVMFRGPFRGYGEILIIEHGGGYHTLLAGLGRTDAVVGQWLLAGEPVGIMGPSEDGNPKLYVELRHGGQPINPLPWMESRDSKVE